MGTAAAYDRNQQVEIQSLTIKRPNKNTILDISPLMEQFIIYEDLFQTSLSAVLIFRDQVNLVGTFPIVGGETVNIQFKTPLYTETINQDFIVYQVGDRGISNSTENIQINKLMLCTPEVWWAANNDASTAFTGTYGDIISNILKTTGTKKKFTKENSVGIVNYVAPSCNVFKAIKFCASRANSKTLSPMFFWESPQGYNLKSLKEIYRAPYTKYVYIGNRNVIDDPDRLFNTAFDFDYSEGNNRLDQYNQGAFGASNFSLDLTNKRINKTVNSYEDVFSKQDIKLNKYPLNDDAKSIRSLDGYIPWRSDQSHLGAYNRVANLAMMDNLKVLVNIPGDSALKAGDVVWLEIPSRSGLGVDIEKFSSGKWLMRSIKHLITKTTYSMTCELTKDSFDVDVNSMGG
jgi:hypothetical protein